MNTLVDEEPVVPDSDRVVFFSRCRPQDSDPIEIVLRERRVFIGWPAWRKHVEPDRSHLRAALVDFWCPDDEWEVLYNEFGSERRNYQQNRNFVRRINPGSIALVPRPSRGVIYAGKVISKFEILDDPTWGSDYLNLREAQGLDATDEFSHLADVAQCCEVDCFRPLPISYVPAWIRRSLFGRSTYGVVKPLSDHGLDPYARLHALMKHPEHVVRDWASDTAEIKRRLLDVVGPSAFEHLCVALLQLEYPEEVWMHVGGSGDGGIDGIGVEAGGRVVGLLQCKWAYWGGNVFADRQSGGANTRQILAALLHSDEIKAGEGVEFWSHEHIASLMVRHADRLPMATSLRIRPHRD